MSDWGEDFKPTYGPLFDIISEFPVKLKKAMYASANKGTIRQRTWNNCALNAASKLEEAAFSSSVSSTTKAAEVFRITPAQAGNFIRIWDNIDSEEYNPTEVLKQTILEVGIFRKPGERLPRIVKKRVYTSQITKDREEFEKMMQLNQVEDIDWADILFNASPETAQALIDA